MSEDQKKKLIVAIGLLVVALVVGFVTTRGGVGQKADEAVIEYKTPPPGDSERPAPDGAPANPDGGRGI